MFDLLDKALTAMFSDKSLTRALPELAAADVSFVTPDKTLPLTDETINLFLYETRENRELRDPQPIVDVLNGMSRRRRPPLRADCVYMVTAWSKKTASDKVAAEHMLLGQAFNWLSRFPVIPAAYLQAASLSGQVFPPPTLVAQFDASKNAGEFWTALGIPPRPFFNLVVTIAMDLDLSTEDPMVTTLTSRYLPVGASSADERIILGGTVRDSSSNPVPNAWVRLEPAGLTQVTDRDGHFIFTGVARASGLTLRARAPGLGEAERTPVEIPSNTRDYDLQFTTT